MTNQIKCPIKIARRLIKHRKKSMPSYSSKVGMMDLKRGALWCSSLVSLFLLMSFASGQNHPCDRRCLKGAAPRTCVYNWKMEQYVTMSVDCGRCPYIPSDCSNIGCIAADGVPRPITVVNRQMPGPAINVCKGDKVVVHLENHAGVDATTIHWHGMNQVGTPYMDGVPMVTQCPIHPFTSFTYTYHAADVGTYFCHSHMGFQRTDGVNCMLVVRQPKEDDPNKAHYDHDLSSHEIMLTDWLNRTGEDMFISFYQSEDDYASYLRTILVNGRGAREAYRNSTTGTVHYTPYSSFNVKQGSRYRFRVCSNANFICPIQVSVVNHDLLVVGTDGDSIKPVRVNAIVVNPGERFDFIINASQPIGTYWMLFRGLLRCEVMNTQGRAILKYETAMDVNPPEPSPNPPKVVLNPVNDPFTNSDQISLLELQSLTPPDASITQEIADEQLFIPFNLYPNLNPEFTARNALLPMVNSTSFLAPPSPMLTQFSDIPKNRLCTDPGRTKNCSVEFCQCAYYLKVKLGKVIEIILVDEGPTPQPAVNHPWHMHGFHFWVIAGSLMIANNTVATVKHLDATGQIRRNFISPVLKDTVSVPHGGYTVIRFHATNPGFWAFHCHVELHTETGMMLVLQVGEAIDFPAKPNKFPRCGNFP